MSDGTDKQKQSIFGRKMKKFLLEGTEKGVELGWALIRKVKQNIALFSSQSSFVGYCVALTNIRANASPSKTSRGLLVKRLLEQSHFEPEKWLELIKGYACTGFNIVFASVRHMQAFVYCSETGEMREIDFKAEPFTLANARPQSHWPREQRILERFSAVADKDYLELLR